MANKINIRSVKMEWLDSRCLAVVSEYAKAAYEEDQTVFNLRDDDVLLQIRQHSHACDNARLMDIYNKLKVVIKACLLDPALSKKVSGATIPDYLISNDTGRASRTEIINRWFKFGQTEAHN